MAAFSVNERNRLLQQSSAYPEYGQLVNFLTERRMLPAIEMQPLTNAYGQFTSPTFPKDADQQGVIGLSDRQVSYAQPRTVIHELSHAAHRQMDNLNKELLNKSNLSPLEQQFIDNYKKIMFNPEGTYKDFSKQPAQQFVNKLVPEWLKKNIGYRSSPTELIGHAMGNAATVDNVESSAPLHVDPTIATEFGILLDLANKVQKTNQVRYTR